LGLGDKIMPPQKNYGLLWLVIFQGIWIW